RRAEACCLADGALGPVRVAAPLLGETADVRNRVVDRLALGCGARRGRRGVAARIVRVVLRVRRRLAGGGRRFAARCRCRAADRHRCGGADVGGRRHRCDVARIEDVGPGACRAGARRPHVDRDGYGRAEDRLDDRPHRGVEPAGRVELGPDQRAVLVRGPLDATWATAAQATRNATTASIAAVPRRIGRSHGNMCPMIALAGRVAAFRAAPRYSCRPMTQMPTEWHPASWQRLPAAQQPTYKDSARLDATLARLAALPPIVTSWEIEALKAELARAQRGEAFLLQGGDCAESFDECTSENIVQQLKILLQMSLVMLVGLKKPVIRVGRLAGQYAKPRSADFETRAGVSLPSYRGDIINRS